MINIFILCTEVLSNTCSLILFKISLYFIKQNEIKFDFPHHAIIEYRAMSRTCRRDSKASTVMSYTRFSNGV